MKEYQMTIERRILMKVVVSAYGETEEEAKANALISDVSYEEEIERIEQKNERVLSVDGSEDVTY